MPAIIVISSIDFHGNAEPFAYLDGFPKLSDLEEIIQKQYNSINLSKYKVDLSKYNSSADTRLFEVFNVGGTQFILELVELIHVD